MNNLLIFLLIILIIFPIILYFIQKYNLSYFKLYGREPIEIEIWLKTRTWYNDFVSDIKNEIIESYRDEDGTMNLSQQIMNEIEQKTNEIISGGYDKNTISSAFCWNTSLKGTEYWGKREYEFLMWYYGQYVDFHLVK